MNENITSIQSKQGPAYLDDIAELSEVKEPTPVCVGGPEGLLRPLFIRTSVDPGQTVQHELVASEIRVHGHSFAIRLGGLRDVIVWINGEGVLRMRMCTMLVVLVQHLSFNLFIL